MPGHSNAIFDGLNQQYAQMFEGGVSLDASNTRMHARYDANQQAYLFETLAAVPAADSHFQQASYLYRKIEGDFIVTAQVEFIEPASSKAKAGWLLRESLTDNAKTIAVGANSTGELTLQSGSTEAGFSDKKIQSLQATNVIQLERRGQQLILSHAAFGEVFTQTELDTQSLSSPLPDQLYIGLFAQTDKEANKVVFRNVRIVIPAWPDLVPYRDYLGSRLELLEVANGHREVVHSTGSGIEAPNWTPDDKSLIYNSDGRLYRFDLATRQTRQIDTGFAVRNNNDHVLSFDGSMLGISHHADEQEGTSIIYKLPVSGGEPQQLTGIGPSYLHGWSPDGKYIIYTAERQGQYDIYRTTTDGKGMETQLTDNPGLDDGSEYSPDGKTIYFNSVRGKRMQLWQMDADGSDQKALTDDNFNNWFPHVSPDGKKLLFLSYLPDVKANEHPYYQQVYLRSMPVSGGKPKVVAYLYGGQATINVPSWSPDGKQVAFVSNSLIAE